jgi:hypothetical protein
MRRYTPQERANIAGLRASGLTEKEIANRVGIPRSSVNAILARTPVAEVVQAATLEQVTARLWEVVSAGTQEALRRIAEPSTRAGELAQLLKVAADQYAHLSGGVTERTENLNVNADADPIVWTTPEMREHLVEYLAQIENSTDEQLIEHENKVLVIERIGRNMALAE